MCTHPGVPPEGVGGDLVDHKILELLVQPVHQRGEIIIITQDQTQFANIHDHRRRINTEEKAIFVAAVGGQN